MKAHDLLLHNQPLPESEAEWLTFENTSQVFMDVQSSPVQCGIFMPPDGAVKDVAVFVGGIPRSEERRRQLPVINKFFGFVAAGLALQGTLGVSFNWPGIGKSPGDVLAGSIDYRIEFLQDLTQTVLSEYDTDSAAYIGASMGAYCAAMAAAATPQDVHKLAFLSPAAYPKTVHSIAYDAGFGSVLRSDPWEATASPIHPFLETTVTSTLIGFCEYDDPPIPTTIQNMYRQAAAVNNVLEYHVIPGVYHNFRRTSSDDAGNAVDNEAVKQFGHQLINFIET